MESHLETALIEILKGVPVAAVLFYFAIQFRKDNEKSDSRYEHLVNRVLDGFSQQNSEVINAMSMHSKIMERVEGKLNEKQH